MTLNPESRRAARLNRVRSRLRGIAARVNRCTPTPQSGVTPNPAPTPLVGDGGEGSALAVAPFSWFRVEGPVLTKEGQPAITFLREAENPKPTRHKIRRAALVQPPFGNVFWTSRLLRFPVVPHSRNCPVNDSPLGAASPSFTGSLSLFYECARRKSRTNSTRCETKQDARKQFIFLAKLGANGPGPPAKKMNASFLRPERKFAATRNYRYVINEGSRGRSFSSDTEVNQKN